MHLHKTLLHCHSGDDPHDRFISYSTQQLIDEAARKGVTIMSLTCHRQVIFDEYYRRYAAARKVLLLPGVEQSVEGRDVNIINADREADQVKTFADLKSYRSDHPESFIFAPHPYFPGPLCLHDRLEQHLDLFDGVELSHFYHRFVDFNKKAARLSALKQKPFFATPDCHFLENVDIAYTLLRLPFSIEQLLEHPNPARLVFATLKDHQFENVAKPLSAFKICKTLTCHFGYGNIINWIKRPRKNDIRTARGLRLPRYNRNISDERGKLSSLKISAEIEIMSKSKL